MCFQTSASLMTLTKHLKSPSLYKMHQRDGGNWGISEVGFGFASSRVSLSVQFKVPETAQSTLYWLRSSGFFAFSFCSFWVVFFFSSFSTRFPHIVARISENPRDMQRNSVIPTIRIQLKRSCLKSDKIQCCFFFHVTQLGNFIFCQHMLTYPLTLYLEKPQTLFLVPLASVPSHQ